LKSNSNFSASISIASVSNSGLASSTRINLNPSDFSLFAKALPEVEVAPVITA